MFEDFGGVSDEVLERLKKDFRDGDLLFGVADGRRYTASEISNDGRFKSFPTIDQILDEIFHPTTREYMGGARTTRKEALDHATYLEAHPKYNPLLIEKNDDFRDIAVKRACKAAIEKVLQPENPQRIHFLLDLFDKKKAMEKDTNPGFTNAEFRFIYREWLKNPELVDQKIIFWSPSRQKLTASHILTELLLKSSYNPKSVDDERLSKLKAWAEKTKSKQAPPKEI